MDRFPYQEFCKSDSSLNWVKRGRGEKGNTSKTDCSLYFSPFPLFSLLPLRNLEGDLPIIRRIQGEGEGKDRAALRAAVHLDGAPMPLQYPVNDG
jgi:hypothetical protein